jgi:hypothetical protein
MSAIIDKTKPKKTKKPKLVIVESDDVNIKTEIEETKPAPKEKPKSKSKKSKTTEVKVDEDDQAQLDTSDEKVEDYNPETNIKIIVSNEKNESEVVVNDYDEIVYSFHITNVHTGCTIQQLNSSLEILALGEVFQISIKTMYNGHITEKEKSHESRQSEAYIYYKGTMHLIKKHPFLQRLLSGKKIELAHFLDGENWKCELNVQKHYHFRTDEYIHKRIIIQSISTTKGSNDINWIFREHGEVEQVDMVWVKSDKVPTPTRAQSYIYFKEWGDEEYTYKLLDELNETGVFTIKYDFKEYHDLLWIYELSPKNETSTEYDFEYGQYRQWIPRDDPKYGSRYDEKNKLNWIFSEEGRFAYSQRIVEDEIKKHGGLFIGPEKKFYRIEVERKPIEFSWTATSDNEGNEEVQKVKMMILEALQKCLNKNESIGDK